MRPAHAESKATNRPGFFPRASARSLSHKAVPSNKKLIAELALMVSEIQGRVEGVVHNASARNPTSVGPALVALTIN